MKEKSARARPLLVGAVAYHPKAVTIWETIRDLFRGSDPGLDFVLFSNYESQVEALFAGTIEIAWNTPLAWVRCDRRSGGKARPLAMRDTDLGYTTKLLMRGKGVQDLAAFRGRRIGLGSRDSSQAAILPEHFLRRAGLKAGKDYQAVRFDSDVGKHGDTGSSEVQVVDALLGGEIDAGAVGCSTWADLVANGRARGLQEVWTSPPYSHCNFTALPALGEERAGAFVDRLFSMRYEDPEVQRMMDLEGLKKWVPGTREGYQDLAEAVAESEV